MSQGRIAEWDSDGNPTRMLGTHTDITEKKHFEFLQIARNHVLDAMIAKKNLYLILEEIVREIESIHPEMKASILLLDSEGKLRKGAAPSLPDFYNEAIEGIQSGFGVGSCGTAAATGDLVSSSAGGLGINMKRFEPDGEQVRVWLEGADFAKVANWLNNLSEQGVAAQEVHFEQSNSGLNVRLVFGR